jgi:flagellar motor switch protein FliN/FliY
MDVDMGKNSSDSGRSPKVINENSMANQAVQGMGKPEVQPENAASSSKAPGRNNPAHGNLDFILDIPMMLTVELGRSQMLINDLLKLGRGSVVELSKLAGEPLDILANQRLIARGEVVVVNEKYGIRITEIISPAERVERLK